MFQKKSINHQELVSNKDCEALYELVFSSHRAVAQAAGEFLNERLFDEAAPPPLWTHRGKEMLPNTTLIWNLVQLYTKSQVR